MTRASAAVAFALLAAAAAAAQTPTVTAEAVELVRVKPDTAKLYLRVETRHPKADTSADLQEEAVKTAVDDLKGLRLKGMTVTPQNQQTARVEQDRLRQTDAVYLNSHTLLVTVADANPEQLAATVAKLQQEALKLGLVGDTAVRPIGPPGGGVERGAAPHVVYEKKDGWDAASAPAVAKATKRAVQKAELLATSAGLRPGAILAVSDGSETPTATDDQTTFTDGELVRKVRVRVVLAATAGK